MYLIISGNLIGTAKEQIYSLTSDEPNIFVLDIQSLDLLSGGDGHETCFMYTTQNSDVSYPAGLKFNPILPLMHKGMMLSIGMDLEKYGYSDFLEIMEVSYDPILREQLITIKLPLNDEVKYSDKVRKLATKELEKWFDEIGVFLNELIEYELLKM